MTTGAERMFEAAAELGRLIAEARAAERQRQRDARNRRRRARYAATKHLRVKAAVAPVAPVDEDEAHEASCWCHIAAPCGRCASLIETDIDAMSAPRG